jgi:UDP-3-O-[3-hydroxymyristoyl] glucosamine N-acyltransferase
MELSFTPAAIEALVKPRKVAGSTDSAIKRIAALDSAKPGDLAFLANPKYRGAVAKCAASLILLPADFPGEPPPGQRWVFVDDPSVALTLLCKHVEAVMRPRPAAGVHPSAVIDTAATVAADAHIGPLCVVEAGASVGARTIVEAGSFIGRDAQIGEDCRLGPRSVIASQSVLGRRVQLQPGVIIGGDGYGYNTVGGRHEKIPQLGIVEIHDDVEIGAGCTIDRARFSKTVIGEGTKLDNLVQVGHNVVIGKHCLIVAQVGVSGSTIIGDNVVIGGQAGLAGHLKIGDGAKIAGQTGVGGDVKPGAAVMGTPALPMIAAIKAGVLLERLPELFRRVEKLESSPGQPKNPST